MANGEGIRAVLWVSGCEHHCKGCHNSSTWDRTSGKPFTDKDLEDLIQYLSQPFVAGLTLSGGDPLETYNREQVTQIVKTIKNSLPQKNIWCYTGYLWEDIKDLEVVNYLDVLVDGEFIQDQRDVSLKFRGSSNQRIIDVFQTIQRGVITLVEFEKIL